MFSDLPYAFRQLRKAPALTLVIVLSLGFGIGAVATVVAWLQGIVLQPIAGAAKQSELVAICGNQGGTKGLGNISLVDARDIDEARDIFAGLAVSQISPALLTVGQQTDWSYGQITTANFFEILQVKPILGRTFLPEEDRKPGGDAVLVISERLWKRRFAADPALVGKVVELNRHPFTIVGVVPARFNGSMTGLACEFWTPITMYYEVTTRYNDSLTSRSSRGLHSVARLAPGVPLERAQAAVDTIDARLETAYPKTNRDVHFRVLAYSDCPYGAQALFGQPLRLLLGLSAGLLLMVVANIANLQLSRLSSRQTELAIRVAAGASRWRIARLLLVESAVLAAIGSVLGLVLASWGVDALKLFAPAVQMPLALGGHLGGLSLLAAGAAGLVCAGLIAAVPMLQVVRGDLTRPLRESARSAGSSVGHHRARSVLVVAELALAIVLLIGASLCGKGFNKARQIEQGLDTRNVLVAPLQIGMSGYTVETGRVFYRQLQERIAAVPEVENVAYTSWLPLGLEGCKGHGVDVPGYVRKPGENPTFEYAVVSPGYFETLRIPLTDGRDFSENDKADAPLVAIVNQAFAEKFWPGQNPIGRTFRAAGRDRTIVGLTPTAKYNQLTEPAHPFFFMPYTQYVPDLDLRLIIRTKGDPAAFTDTVRKVVHDLDRSVELWGPQPLARHVEAVLFPQRTATVLILWLGAVALTLSAMGVYAVMAYAVSQRIPEFGIRLALGAQQRDLVFQVEKQGMKLAATGAAIGLVLAFSVTRLLSSLLYGISPFDPLTFLLVPLALTLVALIACWIPALRAARVDPMEALRTP
ncbi:permease [Opitutaceae bacterium EW11]|nr:permease [Opitutaceae bacterium EW11]